MAEFAIGLIVLPFLYVIGDFYWRLGEWCWRRATLAWRAGIEVYRKTGGGGQHHAG